jgi:hypothetical protein
MERGFVNGFARFDMGSGETFLFGLLYEIEMPVALIQFMQRVHILLSSLSQFSPAQGPLLSDSPSAPVVSYFKKRCSN